MFCVGGVVVFIDWNRNCDVCFRSWFTASYRCSSVAAETCIGIRMVDRNLLREFDISDEELELAADISLAEAEHLEEGSLDHLYNRRDEGYDVNAVLEGTVVRVEGEEVLI